MEVSSSLTGRVCRQSYDIVVEPAIGGKRRSLAAPWLSVEGGGAPAGFRHYDFECAYVPQVELRFDHDMGGAAGHEHVSPELAESPAPPCPTDQCIEELRQAVLCECLGARGEDGRIVPGFEGVDRDRFSPRAPRHSHNTA